MLLLSGFVNNEMYENKIVSASRVNELFELGLDLSQPIEFTSLKEKSRPVGTIINIPTSDSRSLNALVSGAYKGSQVTLRFYQNVFDNPIGQGKTYTPTRIVMRGDAALFAAEEAEKAVCVYMNVYCEKSPLRNGGSPVAVYTVVNHKLEAQLKNEYSKWKSHMVRKLDGMSDVEFESLFGFFVHRGAASLTTDIDINRAVLNDLIYENGTKFQEIYNDPSRETLEPVLTALRKNIIALSSENGLPVVVSGNVRVQISSVGDAVVAISDAVRAMNPLDAKTFLGLADKKKAPVTVERNEDEDEEVKDDITVDTFINIVVDNQLVKVDAKTGTVTLKKGKTFIPYRKLTAEETKVSADEVVRTVAAQLFSSDSYRTMLLNNL